WAEVNDVVRKSDAARQFAASSWLDGRSNGKAIPEAKASSPAGPLRVRMALANSASPKSDRDKVEGASMVCLSERRLIRGAVPAREPPNSPVRPRKRLQGHRE